MTDFTREWITKREQLEQAATEEPWFQDFGDPGLVWGEQRSDGDGYWSLFASETGHDATAQPQDAEFIADARTSLPAAVAALKAALGATEGKTEHYGHTPLDGDDCAACLATDVRDAVEAALRGES